MNRLGYAVLLRQPGMPDKLTDHYVRDRATAATEARGWNLNMTTGTAVVVELREVPNEPPVSRPRL